MKWILVCAMVAATAASDLLQSYDMKLAGAQSASALGLARILKLVMRRRYLMLSVACLAVSFASFLALVQTEPLSFAVPVSAATYILETLFARLLLREPVGARRAAGAALVLGGIILLGR